MTCDYCGTKIVNETQAKYEFKVNGESDFKYLCPKCQYYETVCMDTAVAHV